MPVTEDFPTPPLPLTTAISFLTWVPGWGAICMVSGVWGRGGAICLRGFFSSLILSLYFPSAFCLTFINDSGTTKLVPHPLTAEFLPLYYHTRKSPHCKMRRAGKKHFFARHASRLAGKYGSSNTYPERNSLLWKISILLCW
jgi:hypothetical protein